MAITVPLALAYEFAVHARYAEVFSVLADVPTSASHFPKLARLVDLGDQRYRWEMEKLGTDTVHLQTVYAAQYVANKRQGRVDWTPLAGIGNAQVGGSWVLSNKKTYTQLVLRINAQLQLPLPGLMKSLVAPVVQAEYQALVEQYIDKLIQRFGGEHV